MFNKLRDKIYIIHSMKNKIEIPFECSSSLTNKVADMINVLLLYKLLLIWIVIML